MVNKKDNKSILVIDDKQYILNIVKRILEYEGYKVITSNTGSNALELIKTENPDLIITDINIGEMNGLDLCREIRDNILYKHTQIIVLSGERPIDIQKQIELKISKWITKPFEYKEFVNIINSLLH
jgi:DNA-binding response OmpR family regulator